MTGTNHLHGVAAEFEDPAKLVDAAKAFHLRGYRRMEAYSPYPIKELDDLIEGGHNLPLMVLIGGLLGTLTAWSLQFYIAVIDYPINIGGRPLNSWPSFIVIMFELTILFAALTAFFGMLGLCGFPRPHHPMFSVPNFGEASNNRFFLCVEACDPYFNREEITGVFASMNPLEVHDVEEE